MKSDEVLGGTVYFGMVESIFELLPNEFFLEYHKRFPNVLLDLDVTGTAALKNGLLQGTLDAACLVDYPLSPTEWSVWESLETPIVIIANPNHFLANRSVVQLRDICGQRLILMKETAPYSIQFNHATAKAHLTMKPFLRLKSAQTADGGAARRNQRHTRRGTDLFVGVSGDFFPRSCTCVTME
uniref:LysR family transcriptional regulator substrate-binding protein n=1 Tax=Ndongobacter massiliensis TaxID=1871025 RepID=UPI00092FE5CA|nr:LysR family transcriptional regulator substrate-binding protein [Ndongobacter massiliensis]